jgi:hypothetical protein
VGELLSAAAEKRAELSVAAEVAAAGIGWAGREMMPGKMVEVDGCGKSGMGDGGVD